MKFCTFSIIIIVPKSSLCCNNFMINKFIISCFLTAMLTISSIPSFAQKFKADKYGYVAAPEFHELIKQRNYQLVSAFDTLSFQQKNKPVAVVVKNDKPYWLDLDGNEFPYNDFTDIIKAREKWLRKPYQDSERKYHELIRNTDSQYQKNRDGDLYGLIRKSDSKVILQPQYQWIQSSSANFILLKKENKYGVADTLGHVFITPKYDYIEACMVDSSGIDFFIANNNGGVTLVNRKGKEMFAPRRGKIYPFMVDGVLNILSSENGEPRFGLVSKEGKIILEPYCRDFYNITNTNYLRTETDPANKMGLVNKQGNIILEPVYDNVDISISNGFISFRKDGMQGLVDCQTNRINVPLFYNKLEVDAANRVIICSLKQKSDKPFSVYKYGLIDYNNKIKIAVQYDDFIKVEKYYLAKKDSEYFLLEKSGKVLRQFKYSHMLYVNNYFIAVNKDGLYGVVDISDKIKIPFDHSRIEPTGDYYFATENGIYNSENELVAKGNASDVSFTNNLPLRKAGIIVLRQHFTELFKDRYGSTYIPKKDK